MKKEMRRKDRQLSEKEAMSILLKGEYGILSTIDEDYPYAVPVNYVVLDNSIYIHSTCEISSKNENMRKNPKVCFTVVGHTKVLPSKFTDKYESAVVLGEGKIVNDEKEKLNALEEFINKYSHEFKESGLKYIKSAQDKIVIHKISIKKITGKGNK